MHVGEECGMLVQMYRVLSERKGDKIVAEWKSRSRAPRGLLVHGGMSDYSVDGTTHTVTEREQGAFSDWINRYATPSCIRPLQLPACFCPCHTRAALGC